MHSSVSFDCFTGNTTGNSGFAVCHRHSTKPTKHSAKILPSVTLGKQHTISIVSANASLPSVCYRTLGKHLPRAETDARRKKVTRRHRDGHGTFAKCQLPDTRQTCILCRVPTPRHSAKLHFAMCQILGTRQTCLLCRVLAPRHSAKISPLPSVNSETLGKDWPRTY